MKSLILSVCLFLSLSFSSLGRNVVSWVPVYGISNCKTLITTTTSSNWFKNGLTHVGLQFWVPGDNGAVVFLTNYQFTNKAATIGGDVNDFVTWGNTNNVKTMMCLFNMHEDDFDWTIAKNVIDNYPNQTVTNIMTIVNTYNLDGVDIDFEGTGNFSADKNKFVAFLDTLGKALHASGKELSVDMFSTPCYNAPNPSWESAMAPHVDFMNLMGYTDTYEDDATLFQYCPQTPSEANTYPFRYSYIENYLTETQGVASSKLNYGLPGWAANWGGQCAHENILDIVDISTSGGIAIWDLQLGGNGVWTEAVTWELIAKFKNNKTSAEIRSDLLVCGLVTEVKTEKELSGDFFYDYNQKLVHLPETEGELCLFSALGIKQNSWKVSAGETISLNGKENGVYILRFESKAGARSKTISIMNHGF